jgi:hypothetical protein
MDVKLLQIISENLHYCKKESKYVSVHELIKLSEIILFIGH